MSLLPSVSTLSFEPAARFDVSEIVHAKCGSCVEDERNLHESSRFSWWLGDVSLLHVFDA